MLSDRAAAIIAKDARRTVAWPITRPTLPAASLPRPRVTPETTSPTQPSRPMPTARRLQPNSDHLIRRVGA